MSISAYSASLRQGFADDRLIQIVGAHNALGARVAARAGFDGVWLSGLELSASCGVPDSSLVTMTETLTAAETVCRAVSIPVVVDCDTGYGDAQNVAFMTRRFEHAGVAAVCIEDKVFPKRNSFAEVPQQLLPIEDFVEKIQAAKSAQAGSDLMVIARVEALIAGESVDEALTRAHAYAAGGADAVLIHSKERGPDQIARFLARWNFDAPVVVVPTTYYEVSAAQLEAWGVSMVIYANHGVRASIRAMQEAYAEILTSGSTATIEDSIATLPELFDLQHLPEVAGKHATPPRDANAAQPRVLRQNRWR